jgi:hypothetical protein
MNSSNNGTYLGKERLSEVSASRFAAGLKEKLTQQPLPKILRIKLFEPGNKKHKVYIFRAGDGRHFAERGAEDILGKVVAEIEKMYPEHEYAMVQVGKGDYNFMHRGHKEVAAEDIVVAGLRLGEVVTVEVGS